MFKKILIANRGEIAMRIIRTCKEMTIRTVAIYSKADADSLHVKFADEAVCVGPASSLDSYLNIPNLISAAEITNADAIHPGYGFLSENDSFSKICQEHNIKFIGASPEMIKKMGDKSAAKATMKSADIPVVPGSNGLINSLDKGIIWADKIGYPVMLKAAAGGGGKGIRLISKKREFKSAWESASAESKASFNNGNLYLEKFIEEPRHIEIQVLGDQHGNACHLSERDCSIQRRHQKLVEESPAPFIDEKLRKKMGDAAIRAAKYINYEGAGTVEFLVDEYKNFYFMEMNTRIQVEHPVTEQVTGLDLVKEQIKIAAGIPISEKNYFPSRHAIECRINAEDPKNNFRPYPGKIHTLHIPGGIGIRIDTYIYADYTIPPYYDSMVAKLIVSATSRIEAIHRMKRALEEFTIEGIKTTIPFHIWLMNHPIFKKGKITTKFIDEHYIQ